MAKAPTKTATDFSFAIPEDVKKRLKDYKYESPQDEAIQLPLWPDITRAMPNHIARSQLFAPIQRGSRKVYDREKLASREDVEIFYTGKQLDMADQDVFFQVLELFKHKDLNERYIAVLRSDILKAIGKYKDNNSSGRKSKTGGSEYVWLEEVMHRLKTGTLTIITKRYKTELSLVDEWTRDESEDLFKIAINPKIKVLFSNNEFGFVNWNHRMAIENKIDLSKWLQTYIASHGKEPQRHRFDTIKKLTGAKTRINDYREDVEEALKELQRVKDIVKYSVDKVGFDIVIK